MTRVTCGNGRASMAQGRELMPPRQGREIIPVDNIYAEIDSMPMRQEEMRRQ